MITIGEILSAQITKPLVSRAGATGWSFFTTLSPMLKELMVSGMDDSKA
jgi:hypothetical protein